MLADYRLNVFAFCYHWLQELPDNATRCPALRSIPNGLSQRLGSSAWGKSRWLSLSVSVSSITINAVLCRVVFGGRILRGPWFARLQVIVIAPPDWRLNAICRISQEMKDIIDAVSPRVAYCGHLNDGFPTWVSEIPPPERFIAICLTPFAILRGRVFPFQRGRWVGQGCPTKPCSLCGLDL